MRQIKFRGWAIASRKMFGPGAGNGWEILRGKLDPLPNTILMQFTERKDRNGKDLYDGDIIGDDSFAGDNDLWKAVIYWSESGSWNVREITGDHGIAMLAAYNPEFECDYIGNIHENPELLNEPT